MFICCTGNGLLVEEQKIAEIVFSWLDYHWNSLALGCTCLPTPGGIYLWEGFCNGFLLGQTCEVPATARGNHFRTVACLDSLDMFICCTGIRLLVEEQKMAGTVLADLIIPEIRLSVTTAVSGGENFYLPICRSLHLLGPFVQRCWARQYLAHAFSELNQKNSPNASKSLANACTFSTREFAASCDTTRKSHFMCASGDGKRSKHAKNKLKKLCIVGVNAKVKVQLATSKLSWTHKFPQSEMFLPCTEIKKQTELWICQFFYCVSVYNPSGFLCRMALVRQYCCDIVQSSLVNHQNHSFNRRIKLANCFQPPAH